MTVQSPPVADEFAKQPWESYIIGVDNSNNLETGEYVLGAGSSTVTAVDINGDDATADVLDNTDLQVQTANADDIKVTPITNGMLTTRVKGGTEALSKYRITFKAITSNGNQYETDVKMRIKNVV